jgi:single-strand DNA-binding protein
MASLSIIGNIGQEPELKFTNSGKAVLNFSVADTLRRKNQQTGEWEDVSTTWWRVQVWEKTAETLAEHLHKGVRVMVDGTVHAREFEKDGVKRLSYDVTARSVGIMPKAAQGAARPVAVPASDPWAAPPASSGGFPNDEPPF